MRTVAMVGTVILAVLGLLTWELVALVVSFAALLVACIALWRTNKRDEDVEAWKADQLARAQAQGEALADDLSED